MTERLPLGTMRQLFSLPQPSPRGEGAPLVGTGEGLLLQPLTPAFWPCLFAAKVVNPFPDDGVDRDSHHPA